MPTLGFGLDDLKDGGIFYAITGSAFLYQRERDWTCFISDYSENSHPSSGSLVKVGLKDVDLGSYDYYWTEEDYKECFEASNLKLVKTHYPLGFNTDPYTWQDEKNFSPFVTFVAQKTP